MDVERAPERRPLRGRRLQVDILTALETLLLATVGTIAWSNHRATDAALRRLSDALMDQVTDSVTTKTRDYLAPAARVANLSASLLSGAPLALPRNERLEHHARSVLREYPQFAMFSAGDEGGNFLLARRMADGTIALKRIDRRAGAPDVRWAYHDDEGAPVREERVEDDYDPRARGWYRGARASPGVFWSDLYVFHSDRQPGLTAASRVTDADGGAQGVVGIDLGLGALSTYLGEMRIGESGRAFIVDAAGAVVALPGDAPSTSGGELRPHTLAELGDAALGAGWNAFRDRGAGKFAYDAGGRRHLASFVPLPSDFGKAWTIGVVVPEHELLGALEDANRRTLAISAVVLLLAIAAAVRLSRNISRPILALTAETRRITALDFAGMGAVRSGIREIQEMTRAMQSMKTALGAFRRYVPATLVRQLVQTGEEARLGGARREVTVFFSDIAGFTGIAERLPPEELMRHVSTYLDEVTRIVMEHQGTVDKYIGDAVMAFWGAPAPVADHALLACRAAMRVQERVRELNAAWAAEGKVPLPTRIGLGTGDVVVGNLGSQERMNYTVVGDTVNLTARLESANKQYGTATLVGETTAERVRHAFRMRPVDLVAVKGRERALRVYELLGEKRPGDDALAAVEQAYEEAFAHWLAGRWDEAEAAYLALATARPDDALAALYVERARTLRAHPPERWDGVMRLAQK